MGTYRMYTGDDGQTHYEGIDLSATPPWTSGQPTTDITFREIPVGNFASWHPAPRRQYVIILSGQLEIGFGDGSKRVFGPGGRPPGGRPHRPGPHDRRARRPALRDRNDTAGVVLNRLFCAGEVSPLESVKLVCSPIDATLIKRNARQDQVAGVRLGSGLVQIH